MTRTTGRASAYTGGGLGAAVSGGGNVSRQTASPRTMPGRDPEWMGTMRLGTDMTAVAWLVGGWVVLLPAGFTAWLSGGAWALGGVSVVYLVVMGVGAHLNPTR